MAKIPGSLWVEKNELHYVDQFAREWYTIGVPYKNAAAGAKGGAIYYPDEGDGTLAFIDEWGIVIYKTHAIWLGAIPVEARIGSIWIHPDNLLHWVHRGTPTYRGSIANHLDVYANTHEDSHGDGGHVDYPHGDGAHGDAPHSDYHTDQHDDYPFGDSAGTTHGDFNDAPVQHGDQSDHHDQNAIADLSTWPQNKWAYYHSDIWFFTAPPHNDRNEQHYDQYSGYGPVYYDMHDDMVGHNDYPHGDAPHQDSQAGSHADNPHYDHGDYVTGNVPHSDSGHGDNPHYDAPHDDVHNDAHADTPHGDEPIYVGP